MQLQLQGAYLHFFPDLRVSIERRLERALSLLKQLEPRATVRLSGKRSWRCQIRLQIPGLRSVAVAATRPLPSAAIDGAMEQLVPSLLRALDAKQHFRRRTISKKGLPT
jgi:ribosome-associated translation inhibitor RaiA